MIDLNTLIPVGSGWLLQEATGINASGDICGYGVIGGQTHAFELKPTPELSSGALLLLGALPLGLAWGRRRKS
jgi:hypothetical protein